MAKAKKSEARGPAGMPPLPGGPIDWKAWEAEVWATVPKRRGGPGRTLTPQQRENISEGQRKRFARHRAQLAAAVAARPPAPPAPMRSVTVYETILGAMQPGNWYSTRDMADASGENYQSCKALGPKWLGLGWVERAQNPAWKPPERPGMAQEPKWLYRLTQEGEKRHRLAVALL